MESHKEYSLDAMENMSFESEEPVDLWAGADVSGSLMLTDAELADMPEDETHQVNELRMRLSELFVTRFDSSYAKLECACGISHSLFQKVLKFRNGRNITYNFLSKFCIGAELSVEETEELFLLMGHVLSDKNRSDYILKCELIRHSDIEEYDRTLKQCGLKRVLSSPD